MKTINLPMCPILAKDPDSIEKAAEWVERMALEALSKEQENMGLTETEIKETIFDLEQIMKRVSGDERLIAVCDEIHGAVLKMNEFVE